MTYLTLAAVAVLAASACAGTGNGTESAGEFVVLRRQDTVSIERFAIDARRIRGEITSNFSEVDSIEAWLGRDGAPDSVLITESDEGERWIEHLTLHDSSVTIRSGKEGSLKVDTVRTSSRAMAWYGLALVEAVLRRIQLGNGDSRTVVLGDAPDVLRDVVFARTGDTILVTDNRRLAWLAVDEQMNIQGGRQGTGDRIVRRSLSGPTPSSARRAGWLQQSMSQLGKCPTSATSYPLTPLSVQLDDQIEGRPTHLRSDRKGSYPQASKGVRGVIGPLLEMALWGQPADQDTSTGRYLTVDLTQPVAGSGSKSLGKIADPHSAVAVFYRWDAATDSLFGPMDMAVGEKTPAARVELMFHVEGKAFRNLSTLSFGSFPRGHCEEGLQLQNNVGTTVPTLERTSKTTWTVTIPSGSAGRLWYDIEDFRPAGVLQDRGLYSFSARLRFTLMSP